MTRISIYPGSFDPITNGHVDIVERSLTLFDHVTLLIAPTRRKEALFTIKERMEMLGEVFPGAKGKEVGEGKMAVDVCPGLLMDYARVKGVTAIVRGLRAVADFEYEFQMAAMNKRLYAACETVFIMTGEPYYYLSSSTVKEIAFFGGEIKGLVPPAIEKRLRQKFRSLSDK